MTDYWKWVAIVGWRLFRERISSGWKQVILFAMQTALIFAILFFSPWFGDYVAESRLAAASSIAVMLTAALLLLFDLLRAPKVMNDLAKVRLSDLRKAIHLDADAKAVKDAMLSLCREGRGLVAAEAPLAEILAWKDRALDCLRAYYDINFVYEFEHETRFSRSPKDESERAEWLVDHLENTALCWGSLPERRQEQFSGSRTPAWLGVSDRD